VPFAITFVFGILVASLFSCFTSTNKINKSEVNEVPVYSSSTKKDSCRYDKQTNVYSLQTKEKGRIVKPTFEQTIIINKNK
jgi:hypothetical protein